MDQDINSSQPYQGLVLVKDEDYYKEGWILHICVSNVPNESIPKVLANWMEIANKKLAELALEPKNKFNSNLAILHCRTTTRTFYEMANG